MKKRYQQPPGPRGEFILGNMRPFIRDPLGVDFSFGDHGPAHFLAEDVIAANYPFRFNHVAT